MNEIYQDRLKMFREEEKKTQAELAEDLEVNSSHVSRLEIGKYAPSIPLHVKICLTLNKPSDCFFKQNRSNITLTEKQIKYLESLDEDRLRKILNSLEALI